MNIIKKIKLYLQLREAVRLADEAHAKDGGRYYVVTSPGNKLIVMNRKEFRKLRSKHYIARDKRINDIVRGCVYYTPYADGSHLIGKEEYFFRRKKFFERCK